MAPNMDTVTEDQKAKALMEKYPEWFEVIGDRNKVVCKLTKHELPLKGTAMQTYIDGKKFQSYLKKVKKPKVIEKLDNRYKEYFRPSKHSTSRLYCTLTRTEINKQPHDIERYITGYRFLKAVKRDGERKEKGGGTVVEETKKKEELKDTNDEEVNDEEEPDEDDVPFYALSSEGEEGEEGEEDDIIDEDMTMEGIPDDIVASIVEEVTDSKSENELELEDEIPGVDDVPEETSTAHIIGKKRKGKGKKEKTKSKKLKGAGT